MRRTTTLFLAALTASIGGAIDPAVATPLAPVASDTGATGLAAEGVRLRRAGKDQQALPLFQEALRLEPTPRAFAQLGICEQALGLWVAAETHITEALKHQQDAWISKNEAALRQALGFVSSKVGQIEIWGTPPGARILIDGQPVAKLPIEQPLRVAQGRRVITVEAPSFLTDTRTVDIRAGSLSREHVALVPNVVTGPAPATVLPIAGPAPAIPVETPPDSSPPAADIADDLPTWRRVLPWTLVAASIAATAIGVWQHVDWRQEQNKFESIGECAEGAVGRGSDMRCGPLYDNLSSSRTYTFVGYGAAVVLGAAATTGFILNANTASGDRQHAISPGPGTAGVAYSLRF